MDKIETAAKAADDLSGVLVHDSLPVSQASGKIEKQEKELPANAAPTARIADGVITFASDLSRTTGEVVAGQVREVNQVFGKRDTPEDQLKDRIAVDKELHLRYPAGINEDTTRVLTKDADLYPPVNNADGSTSYQVVQIGMTNRPISQGETTGARYYARTIDVTVPVGAGNLVDCVFAFGDRREIGEQEFNQLLSRDRAKLTEASKPGSGDVNLHTHGVFTYIDNADQEAIFLELTNGHPTVNVDWQAFPNTRQDPHHFSAKEYLTSYLHYMQDRSEAKKANHELEPMLDQTIARIGAAETTMIGFSHGGMFDTRYLRHRVDSHLPKLGTVLYVHPDVPKRTSELAMAHSGNNTEGLFSAAASRAFVIGGTTDSMLKKAAWMPFAWGSRLGNDSPATRTFIEKEGATPITEVPNVQSEEHFINYSGVASLENGDRQRSTAQLQQDFEKASEIARKALKPDHPAPQPARPSHWNVFKGYLEPATSTH